jgi:hypothetical protein
MCLLYMIHIIHACLLQRFRLLRATASISTIRTHSLVLRKGRLCGMRALSIAPPKRWRIILFQRIHIAPYDYTDTTKRSCIIVRYR